MRIITGKYRGRAIKMPVGISPFHKRKGRAIHLIRPTQNKVRKAIFDILGDLEGFSFLELFAGTGAVGFEALSRGAEELVLAENNRQSILAIKENIDGLRLGNCQLLPLDTEKAIEILLKNKKKFDIIFLDPPYFKKVKFEQGGQDSLTKKTLQLLGACDILAANGFIIVQHFIKDNLPDAEGGLILFKCYKYGDTVLSLYRAGG